MAGSPEMVRKSCSVESERKQQAHNQVWLTSSYVRCVTCYDKTQQVLYRAEEVKAQASNYEFQTGKTEISESWCVM